MEVMTVAEVSNSPPHVARRTGKYDWAGIVEALKASPGEWQVIDDSATLSLQTAIRKRKMVALRDPEWDFKVSVRGTNRENNTCTVWMCAVKREDT